MNIWILNHYAHPPDTPGGTRHYDFARELITRGYSVTIFASSFDHRTRKDKWLTGKQGYLQQSIDGIDFAWLKTPPYFGGNDWHRIMNMLTYTFRAVSLGLKLKDNPHVVLASSPHPFAGLAGWLLAKLKGAVFIFEVRDLWPQTLVEIGGYSNKSTIVTLLRTLEKFLYQRARKIVVLLPKGADYITKLGVPVDKIVYIPNGVSPALFSDTGVELPQDMETFISNVKSSEKLLIVYAGAHGIANAMDTILESVRLLKDNTADTVHFLLVGEGPEKQRLIDVAHDWALNNISFFNPIPKEAMPCLLSNSDLALISIKKSNLYDYGMSLNKLWDYMICARPIVWATNSTNDPVAEAGCGITVPPEDPKAMAAAIITLCDMTEQERRQMGMRGREYVLKHNSVPILTDRLIQVIRDATKN
jgi:glycosyltransferase involved in cell wall biosynthesis